MGPLKIFLTVVVFLIFFTNLPRHSKAEVSWHSWDVQHVFVPVGFDDNDNVQVVLDGVLWNSCMVVADPAIDYRLEDGIVAIQPRAMNDGSVCRPREDAVAQTVDLGILPFGDFDILLPDGNSFPLLVAESDNAGPDDHLFGLVDYAWPSTYLDRDGNLALRVELDGYLSDTCQRWDEIEVDFKNGVYVVQPKLYLVDGPCVEVMQEFDVFAELPLPPDAGRYLLHVRSYDGKSLNKVFEF